MGWIFGLLFDAAIIGIIIAIMQKGDFPGWWPMIGCVLAIGITSTVVSTLLPGVLSLLGILAGAAVGAFVISRVCYMDMRRSAMAAGIYLGVRVALSLVTAVLISA